MMSDNLISRSKKTWSKPEFYTLDRDNVNSGRSNSYKEGLATGNGNFSVLTPNGAPATFLTNQSGLANYLS